MMLAIPLLLLLQIFPLGGDARPVPINSVPTTPPAPSVDDFSDAWLRPPYEPFPNLMLIEALHLGLDQSEVVRLISIGVQGSIPVNDPPRPWRARFDQRWGEFGGDRIIDGDGPIPAAAVGPNNVDLLIARIGPSISVWDFKAEAMARLRAVEQTYWTLWEAQEEDAVLAGAIQAIEAAIRRDQDDLTGGRGGIAVEIAEAEQIRDDLRTRHEVARAARWEAQGQLLYQLGSDPALDHPELWVAVTRPPTTVDQPDPARARRQLDQSEPRLNQARAAVFAGQFADLIERSSDPKTPEPVVETNPDRLQSHLRQARRDSEAALDRAIADLNRAATKAQVAQRFRAGVAQRLAAQRAFYDEGRITVVRWAGAIVLDADAAIAEARSLARLSSTRVAFHEAQGTLLTHDGINVSGYRPRPRRIYIQAHRPPTAEPPAAQP